MSKKPSPALFVIIALAAAMTLTACGGRSESTDSSSTATVEASPRVGGAGSGGSADKRPDGQGHGGQSREEEAQGKGGASSNGDDRRDVPVAPLEVSGGGAAQFRVEGGDNSVQGYGEEAGEPELLQAAEATHSLFVASVRGEWARACDLLAARQRKSLERFAAQAPQARGEGCAAGLAAVTRPVPASLAREITQVDAVALRHEGEQAFLVYVGAPEGTVYAMPLRLEGGVWKPAAIAGSALPGVPTR